MQTRDKHKLQVRHWAHFDCSNQLNLGRNRPATLERPEPWTGFWRSFLRLSWDSVTTFGSWRTLEWGSRGRSLHWQYFVSWVCRRTDFYFQMAAGAFLLHQRTLWSPQSVLPKFHSLARNCRLRGNNLWILLLLLCLFSLLTDSCPGNKTRECEDNFIET